jgi:phenylacetate-CoA ligase
MHIMADCRHIEFLDEAGGNCLPGSQGRIAVTDLENYAFPIIRYLNGDAGALLAGPCECGITLPMMDSVKGRITDVVKLPDGTRIAGDYLTTVFDDYPDSVKAFQVRQLKDYSIVLRVVPQDQREESQAIIRRVREGLERKVRSQVPVRLEIVSEIVSDKGKTRFIISELP